MVHVYTTNEDEFKSSDALGILPNLLEEIHGLKYLKLVVPRTLARSNPNIQLMIRTSKYFRYQILDSAPYS